MGVRFSGEEKIAELREWFTRLWSESPLLTEMGYKSLSALHRLPLSLTHDLQSLSSDAPRVNASFVEDTESSTGKTVEVDEESHEVLVKRVQLAPSPNSGPIPSSDS